MPAEQQNTQRGAIAISRIPAIPNARAAGPRQAAPLDLSIIGLAAVIVAVGGYGLYDLVMAPQTTHGDSPVHVDPGRGPTGGILSPAFGGGAELCPGKDQVNLLILGTDELRDGGRADTIMVVMIRKDNRRAAAVSVPRDLMVRTGRRYAKINAVYAFYRGKGIGEMMTAETVSRFLGVPLDYYIKTDVARIARLFDAVGGLDIYVDRSMYWHDRVGELHIDLRSGQQHLNGEQIEGFVRHRRDLRGRSSGDDERTQRQQYVLKELIRQKGNLTTAARLPAVASAVQDMMKTNMTLPELVALGLLAKEVDVDNVISRRVPAYGRNYRNGWYAILRPQATREMMSDVSLALAGGPVRPATGEEDLGHIGARTSGQSSR